MPNYKIKKRIVNGSVLRLDVQYDGEVVLFVKASTNNLDLIETIPHFFQKKVHCMNRKEVSVESEKKGEKLHVHVTYNGPVELHIMPLKIKVIGSLVENLPPLYEPNVQVPGEISDAGVLSQDMSPSSSVTDFKP